MAFPRIAFHPGCHKGLMPETAIIHYRNDLLTLSLDVDVWRQLAGERKGLVLCGKSHSLVQFITSLLAMAVSKERKHFYK